MSGSLDVSALLGFRPKGVNIPSSIVESAKKEVGRKKSGDQNKNDKHNPSKSKKGEGRDLSVSDSALIVSGDHNRINESRDELLRMIEDQKKVIERLKTKTSSFSVNENKVLSAIRSERLLQNSLMPVISRNRFIKEYGINERYLGPSIESLSKMRIISRERTRTENNQLSWSWKILNDE